jgi:hypothetical protein
MRAPETTSVSLLLNSVRTAQRLVICCACAELLRILLGQLRERPGKNGRPKGARSNIVTAATFTLSVESSKPQMSKLTHMGKSVDLS